MPYGRLQVTVVESKKLKDTDKHDKADPYAFLSVDNVNKQRTFTHQDAGANARWNQTFSFDVIEGQNNLYLEVFDENVKTDSLMGTATVSLDPLFKKGNHEVWCQLKGHKNKKGGEILLTMSFHAQTPYSAPPHYSGAYPPPPTSAGPYPPAPGSTGAYPPQPPSSTGAYPPPPPPSSTGAYPPAPGYPSAPGYPPQPGNAPPAYGGGYGYGSVPPTAPMAYPQSTAPTYTPPTASAYPPPPHGGVPPTTYPSQYPATQPYAGEAASYAGGGGVGHDKSKKKDDHDKKDKKDKKKDDHDKKDKKDKKKDDHDKKDKKDKKDKDKKHK